MRGPAARHFAVHLAAHALLAKADLTAVVAAVLAPDLDLVAAVRAVAADCGRSVVAGCDLAPGHAAGSDLAVAIALSVDSAAVAACSRLAAVRAAAAPATVAVAVAAPAAAVQLAVGHVAGFAADFAPVADCVVAVPVLADYRVETAADFHGLVGSVRGGSVAYPGRVADYCFGLVARFFSSLCSGPAEHIHRCQ